MNNERDDGEKKWVIEKNEREKKVQFFHLLLINWYFSCCYSVCLNTLMNIVESLLYCDVSSFKNYSINIQLSTLNSPSSTRYIIIVYNDDCADIGMDYFSFSTYFSCHFFSSLHRLVLLVVVIFISEKENITKKWSERILSFRSFEEIENRAEQ